MSRLVPYTAIEVDSIRCRPFAERTPLPAVGDEVLCRLHEWEDPHPATVDSVQPLDDVDDPHLFRPDMDPFGDLILLEGRPVLMALDDPWVTLWLTVDLGSRTLATHTREARLRGSAGWLPLDWKARRRPLPGQLESLITETEPR